MHQQLVLIGAAQGPWSIIRAFRRPALRVCGSGGKITARLRWDDGYQAEVVYDGAGEFPLTVHPTGMRPSWIQLCSSLPSSSLVCYVVHAKVA